MEAKRKLKRSHRHKVRAVVSFSIGLAVYSVFVVAYLFTVTWLLRGYLTSLFDFHRTLYAIVALALIVVQGVGLDAATTGVLRLINRWK